jgi:hypothetical protein
MRFAAACLIGVLACGPALAQEVETEKITEQKETGSADAKVEKTETQTITVIVTDEDGNIISKDVRTETKPAVTPSNVRVEVVDGKKTVEITLPDGTTKRIVLGAAAGKGANTEVKRWIFRGDGAIHKMEDDVKIATEKLQQALKNVEVDVDVDAGKMAEEIRKTIVRAVPRDADGEMLLELGALGVIVNEDEVTVTGDSEDPAMDNDAGASPSRRIQLRRLSSSADAMQSVMKKLDAITARLESIETRLGKLEKE